MPPIFCEMASFSSILLSQGFKLAVGFEEEAVCTSPKCRQVKSKPLRRADG